MPAAALRGRRLGLLLGLLGRLGQLGRLVLALVLVTLALVLVLFALALVLVLLVLQLGGVEGRLDLCVALRLELGLGEL